MCFTHEAKGLYAIKDEDFNIVSKLWLCEFCGVGLSSNGVEIKRISPTYKAIPKEEKKN